jgi:predicted Na+-dependent transporter
MIFGQRSGENIFLFKIMQPLKICNLFRHFRNPQPKERYYKNLLVLILILTSASLIMILTVATIESPYDFIHNIVSLVILLTVTIFFLLIGLDAFMLISSYFYMIDLSCSADTSANSRFDAEKER